MKKVMKRHGHIDVIAYAFGTVSSPIGSFVGLQSNVDLPCLVNLASTISCHFQVNYSISSNS